MEKQDLRPLVLEFLRRTPQSHLHAVIAHVKESTSDYARHDALRVHEVIWDLLLQGVLAPGKDSLNLSLPFVHVTDDGQRILDEEALLLDPDEYVASLRARVAGPFDDAVLEYVRESVLSFLAGRERVAVELLALASERLLDLLAEAALLRLRSERARASLRAKLSRAGRSPEKRAVAVQESLASITLPEREKDALDRDVAGLLSFLAQSRDQEGAPQLRRVDREVVHASLLLFPGQCARIGGLVSLLRSRRPEGETLAQAAADR